VTAPTPYSAEDVKLIAAAVRRFPAKTILAIVEEMQRDAKLADEIFDAAAKEQIEAPAKPRSKGVRLQPRPSYATPAAKRAERSSAE
jgi:hypothetical protein